MAGSIIARQSELAALDDFLESAQEWSRKAGALFILDEVITFRLSPGGYQRIAGLRPDITAFAKKATTPVSGEISGTATLYCWNTSTGTWKLADSSVTFKATFTDTGVPNKKGGSVKPDSFTVNSPLVQAPMQALKGGNILIK